MEMGVEIYPGSEGLDGGDDPGPKLRISAVSLFFLQNYTAFPRANAIINLREVPPKIMEKNA
jgi:hypothetical protein